MQFPNIFTNLMLFLGTVLHFYQIAPLVYSGDVASVDLSTFDLPVIINVVKKYLLLLPDPVITEEMYPKFIEISSMYIVRI